MLRRTALVGVAMLCALAGPARAGDAVGANALDVTYFTVAEMGDPDFNTIGCCVTNADHMVEPMLGPSGLPVLNRGYGASGALGASDFVVTDVNKAGEIGWWTPGPTIKFTGTGSAALPLRYTAFFPPNGSGADDLNGFQTAVFRGVLHVPKKETVNFTLGVNDVAFVYVDGRRVADIGGVHTRLDLPIATGVLPAGDHCLVLFYADNYPLHAELVFSIDTSDVTASPSSKPGSDAEPDSCAAAVANTSPLIEHRFAEMVKGAILAAR